jgi:hypothetical protein
MSIFFFAMGAARLDEVVNKRSKGQRGFSSCQFRCERTVGHSAAMML